MTRSPLLFWALLSIGSSAQARPIPRIETLVAERVLPQPPAPVSVLSSPPFESTKVVAIDTQLDLDPVTGVVQGHADLSVSAIGNVYSLAVLLDSGLNITSATAPGKTITVSGQTVSGYGYFSLDIEPPLAPTDTVVIAAEYSGTLDCSSQNCKTGMPLAFLIEGSATPMLVDQDSVGSYNAWGATRKLVLSLPSGMDAVASGDLTNETDDGTKVTTTWEIAGFHSYGGNVVMIGNLTPTPVPSVSVTTNVWAGAADQSLVPEMAGWMQKIMPFLDAQAGKPLPYSELKVFKLPLGWVNIFRGTAGYGLTLLSEDYSSPTLATFEETLAHENAHQWWGVLISPTDARKTRWLVEGLATLSQIDYSAEHLNGGLDRDTFLGRRYLEHWLTVRFMGDVTLPLVLPNPNSGPEDPIVDSVWAYFRSSAFLEHLRVVVGDAAFATTLQNWADQCAQSFCDTADFLDVINAASAEDVTFLFSQHVYNSDLPAPKLAFTQPAGGKLSVSATGIDGQKQILELFITLEDGSLVKQKVTLDGSTPTEVDITDRVRRVRPNPRHDGFVWSRPALRGDVDFDGEVDGLDVIHCARRMGKNAGPSVPDGEGIWQHDLDFDPRCDDDDNGEIQEADFSVVTDAFGTLKGAE